MTKLRTGIDLIELSRLEELRPEIALRFQQRVFTQSELDEANGSTQFLSGRFAAKEAVAKALGSGIGPVSWQEIEIERAVNGEPVLRLHGQAAQLAANLGLTTWAISISHSRTHATAVAVALGEETSAG